MSWGNPSGQRKHATRSPQKWQWRCKARVHSPLPSLAILGHSLKTPLVPFHAPGFTPGAHSPQHPFFSHWKTRTSIRSLATLGSLLIYTCSAPQPPCLQCTLAQGTTSKWKQWGWGLSSLLHEGRRGRKPFPLTAASSSLLLSASLILQFLETTCSSLPPQGLCTCFFSTSNAFLTSQFHQVNVTHPHILLLQPTSGSWL